MQQTSPALVIYFKALGPWPLIQSVLKDVFSNVVVYQKTNS